MFRKILALLLLPCVLMSQSAVLGHAHCGREPAGHRLRPHLHVAGASHGHAHPHQSAEEHHHHSHGGGIHHEDSEGQHADTGLPPITPAEHDSDAVYLPCVDAVASSRAVVELEFPVLLGWAFDSVCPPEEITVAVSGDIVRWANAPPFNGPSCPLYLRQLTLLI